MKKICAGYLMLLALLFVLLGIGGHHMIRQTYEEQMNIVSNLAGALFAEAAKDTEQADAGEARPAVQDFVDGLNRVTKEHTDAGAKLLADYGYGERWLFALQDSCARSMRRFFGLLGVFFVLLAGAGVFYFEQTERKRKAQLAGLRDLLERCQREDYSFAQREDELSALYEPLLADGIVKLGQNLVLQTRRLEEEREQTKAMVTDISHQLKTSVSALQSCLAMCMETEGEEREEFLSACRRQGERLEQLTGVLIQVARMEQGMIRLQPEAVFVTALIVEAVNTVYHKVCAKGIRLDTDGTEGISYTVTADPKWTAEAVANLLDNAVKYSPPAGRIAIRVQRLHTYVQIEIEDEGIGVPKEEQTLIFRRFYRGREETVRKEEGWGVGLYLSRKILEEEGGALFMRRGREKGSVFIVHLPVSDHMSGGCLPRRSVV